jgi:hypothetical protein
MGGDEPRTARGETNADRNLKMARSAHAYVRGNTVKFYDWLETSVGKVPEGPPVWICEDCHLGKRGPLADTKGRVAIQIRDLDQTVIGNPAHDLIHWRPRHADRICPALQRREYSNSWSADMRRPSLPTSSAARTRSIAQKEYRFCLNSLSDAAGGSLLWSGWNQSRRFFRWNKVLGPEGPCLAISSAHWKYRCDLGRPAVQRMAEDCWCIQDKSPRRRTCHGRRGTLRV